MSVNIEANFYTTHSPFTDPHHYAAMLDPFPKKVDNICQILHTLFLHPSDLPYFHFTPPKLRHRALQLRYLHKIIDHLLMLDDRPLTHPRDPQKRVLGICRDNALFLCAVLRHHKIPARLRAIYSKYFTPGWFPDGFLVEYFDDTKKRWCLADARTSNWLIKTKKLKIDFDLSDIPPDQYLTAAAAWKLLSRIHFFCATSFPRSGGCEVLIGGNFRGI